MSNVSQSPAGVKRWKIRSGEEWRVLFEDGYSATGRTGVDLLYCLVCSDAADRIPLIVKEKFSASILMACVKCENSVTIEPLEIWPIPATRMGREEEHFAIESLILHERIVNDIYARTGQLAHREMDGTFWYNLDQVLHLDRYFTKGKRP